MQCLFEVEKRFLELRPIWGYAEKESEVFICYM